MSSAVGIFIKGSDRRLTNLRLVTSLLLRPEELSKHIVSQWIWSFDSDAKEIGKFLLSTETIWAGLLYSDFTLLPDTSDDLRGAGAPIWGNVESFQKIDIPVFKGMKCFIGGGEERMVPWYYIFDTEANELHIYRRAGKGGIRYPDRIIRLGKRFDNYHGNLHKFELYATFESLIWDAIRNIVMEDWWLEPLEDYTDYEEAISAHLNGESCNIEEHYARMSRYWGNGTRFYGHTVAHVVETLHRDYLQEVGLDDWDDEEEDEFGVVPDALTNAEYFTNVISFQAILTDIMKSGKMLTPIADYRVWAVDYGLTDEEIASICRFIYLIQQSAWRDNVYYGRHDWYILREVHIELLVQKQGKGK